MKAYFPEPVGQRYWDLHYAYVLESLREGGFEIVYESGRDIVNGARFRLGIYGREAVIDFRDYFDVDPVVDSGIPYFKFHRNQKLRDTYLNVHPLGPVSVHDWAAFRAVRSDGEYCAVGSVIMNNQRARAAALERRQDVRRQLELEFGDRVDFVLHPQAEFWRRGLACLVSVCVPGARNDILDRGQIQFMGLGICTISPLLVCELAGGQAPEPGVHYVTCRPDYQDLPEKIRWCESNRDQCVKIGRQARELFDACCLPRAKWECVRKCLLDGGVT